MADILKTALDRNNGDLKEVDPVLRNILEEKKYQGAVTPKKAAELVWSCIGFGVDLPEILDPYLDLAENRYPFMIFLSPNKVYKERGIYKDFGVYPVNPIYTFMSKGLSALPEKIKELFEKHKGDQEAINLFSTGLLNHLFIEGYFRYFFGGLINIENYPRPPFSMKDLIVRDDCGKVSGFEMWEIVHPDIWDILRLVDVSVLADFFQKHLKDGKVFTEEKMFDGPYKGWQSQRDAPLANCLPSDLYEKIFRGEDEKNI